MTYACQITMGAEAPDLEFIAYTYPPVGGEGVLPLAPGASAGSAVSPPMTTCAFAPAASFTGAARYTKRFEPLPAGLPSGPFTVTRSTKMARRLASFAGPCAATFGVNPAGSNAARAASGTCRSSWKRTSALFSTSVCACAGAASIAATPAPATIITIRPTRACLFVCIIVSRHLSAAGDDDYGPDNAGWNGLRDLFALARGLGLEPQARAELVWDEIDDRFMLRRLPGVFVAGEMIDWDAPTGGYLLQACFSTGVAAAEGVIDWLTRR